MIQNQWASKILSPITYESVKNQSEVKQKRMISG